MARMFKLDNVLIKPLVSIEEYPKLLKSVDVGIVSLSSLNKTGVYPAKILGFMAASLPVFGLLHKQSDGHDLINKSKCGVSVYSNEDQKVKNDIIIKMYNEKDKLKQYGLNGLEYVSNNFSKTKCIDKIDNLIKTIVLI